ncbi:MAG: hypothetical protein IIC64_16875 [SAR324 cluster bacterium]|nr:hypothetical protein [SAR324 cluster bacterium]
MPCDRMSLLKRLAVESPAQLQTPPWQEHMEGCGECRMEKQVLDGTLAVFKQIESEGREQKEFGPSWEEFSQAVDKSEIMEPIPSWLASRSSMASGDAFGENAEIQSRVQAQAEKPRRRRWRMMASLASAASVATVAVTVVGVMYWPVEPLPEAPSSAAPAAERGTGNAKSFSTGRGFPAPPASPRSQTVRRFVPTPKPVFRRLSEPVPFFGQNRWRGGGIHPAPVILFRSLQNRKSMGMDRPTLGIPVERISTRSPARPAKRRTKVGAAEHPMASRPPKTAPARANSNRRPVALRGKEKASPRRFGDGAVKPRVAVKPVSPSPAMPFSPAATSGPPALRPEAEAEALTEIHPPARSSLENMLAPPDEKLTLQARMEAEEMAKRDEESKLDEADRSPDDPESQNDARLEDGFLPTQVAP